MAQEFRFKQFNIQQESNPQKVGTDSMLLGAWTAETLKYDTIDRVLDIGTGTGVLALMMAQSFENATITAIEPEQDSFEEAVINFKNSKYCSNILPIQTQLQAFGAMEKFDLIICNPPYFDGTYLSETNARNHARHNLNLMASELYEYAADLLSIDGKIAVVIPYEQITEHLELGIDNDLFLHHILRTVKDDGTKKRALLIFGTADIEPQESDLLVKNNSGQYSPEYIALTKSFYAKDLSI